jgi:hypothetical protein
MWYRLFVAFQVRSCAYLRVTSPFHGASASAFVFDDKEAAVMKARYEALADALKRDRPDLARVLIPLVQAYPATARHMRAVHAPLNLP